MEWAELGCPPDHHKPYEYWILPWDLLIAHPPCTYLTNSGERWMKNNPERQEKRRQAVEFVKALMSAPIKHKAIENPVGHLSSAIRKPDQIIQPWMFGHPENKGTCLWLENLPPLKLTNDVRHLMRLMSKAEQNRIHYMPPGADRWKERSRTYQGIAEAMAAQWGNLETMREAA